MVQVYHFYENYLLIDLLIISSIEHNYPYFNALINLTKGSILRIINEYVLIILYSIYW